ncbi:MAG: beta,4-xylanase [Ilumatobacteraceae bacterium]|nr:beta,4-xylanase [Ilumatobacteraceae bacterium]
MGLAVVVVLGVGALVGCTGSDGERTRPTPGPGSGADEVSDALDHMDDDDLGPRAPGVPTPSPGCDADECSLRDAAPEDLMVGTAAKLGDPEREAIELREFDSVTSEDAFLFANIHPRPDEWDFEAADRLVAFAEEHDLDLTATHFLWDPPSIPSVLPDWIRAIDDPDELWAVLRDHFQVLHDRYAQDIDRWNVVNEPLDLDGTLAPNHFADVLGPDYVAEAFELAEEVWPETQLVLNQDSTEYLAARADAYVALAEDLLDRGVRLDRVGLQGHLVLGEPDWALIEQTVTALGDLGVIVDLTEIDIPLQGMNASAPAIDLETQAAWAARFVRTCLDEPACGSITFWGFDDGDTWLDDFVRPGTQPLLYDTELQPKPMRQAVIEELLAGRS